MSKKEVMKVYPHCNDYGINDADDALTTIFVFTKTDYNSNYFNLVLSLLSGAQVQF